MSRTELPDGTSATESDTEAVETEAELMIESSEAFVASATVRCCRCRGSTEVICIHCESGTVCGEPLTRFTICDVWAMDEALARQLQPWPTYRRMADAENDGGVFANHCVRCGAPQDDLYLHSEPGEPFFNISGGHPDGVELRPLRGTVRLSGDEHFEVD